MKIGVIIETKEAEKAWNGLRFAYTAKEVKDHEVKVFLMGEAVEIETIEDKKFNAKEQLYKFRDAGGSILACGTCMESRQMGATKTCPMANMIDCVELVEWADKVVTF